MLIMMIFNIVLNKSRNVCTFKYWIGKQKQVLKIILLPNFLDVVMNSYSCVLNYNQVDFQAMLEVDKNKKNKKYHESTLIRQIIYFLIFLIMFLV